MIRHPEAYWREPRVDFTSPDGNRAVVTVGALWWRKRTWVSYDPATVRWTYDVSGKSMSDDWTWYMHHRRDAYRAAMDDFINWSTPGGLPPARLLR